MSTETVPQHLTHTVMFNRKVNLGNYESADVTFFRQFDTPLGVSDDDWIAAADAAFFATKEYVLGEVAQLTGEPAAVVPITSAPSAQAAPVAAQVAEAFGQDQVTEVVPDSPPGGTTKGKDGAAWAKAHQAANPNAWYDNRESKTNPKAPDFRHKDNADWVIWPN